MKKDKTLSSYRVVWDQGTPLAVMIRAGRYSLFNHDINAPLFREASQGFEAELILVHLGLVSIREVRNYFKRQGLEPANVRHLIAFGSAYPEIQEEFHIATLGGRYHYHCGLLCQPASLSCYNGGRGLFLGSPCDDMTLSDSWRYLTVIKSS